jgi:hypothetical protein
VSVPLPVPIHPSHAERMNVRARATPLQSRQAGRTAPELEHIAESRNLISRLFVWEAFVREAPHLLVRGTSKGTTTLHACACAHTLKIRAYNGGRCLQLLVRAGPDGPVQLGDDLAPADHGYACQDRLTVSAPQLIQIAEAADCVKSDRKKHVDVDARRCLRLEHGEKLLDRLCLCANTKGIVNGERTTKCQQASP